MTDLFNEFVKKARNREVSFTLDYNEGSDSWNVAIHSPINAYCLETTRDHSFEITMELAMEHLNRLR